MILYESKILIPAICSFEHELNPTSESTRLEGKEELHEYRAADKLDGSNALITGGEYVATTGSCSPASG
jgi:hypothetical protein